MSSQSAANSSTSHAFVWDDDIRRHLDGAAARMHNGNGDKAHLAQIAKENYRLVKNKTYQDVTGTAHPLVLHRQAVNTTYVPPKTATRSEVSYAETRVCIGCADTATALRVLQLLGYSKVAGLNFANQHHPGGGYLNGARAQEEDLCRLAPTLYSSLKRLRYPMKDREAHFTEAIIARTYGTYQLDEPSDLTGPVKGYIISAAMPNVLSRSCPLIAGTDEWKQSVYVRVRAVLHAAKQEQVDALVLGAFGCGAFGNPPDLVAPIMVEALQSPEFRGCFRCVVFAILVNKSGEDANIRAFNGACRRLCTANAAEGSTAHVDEHTSMMEVE